MTEDAELNQSEDTAAIRALRSQAWETFGHDEFVNQLLGLPYGNAAERYDRSLNLNSILEILTGMCGSVEAGCKWLFSSSKYSEVAESQPYYSLDNGEFWPMEVMLDWLRVIENLRVNGGVDFSELFPIQ